MPSVEAIFHDARQLHGTQRETYLQRACGDDDALRRKIESLLHADASAMNFLDNDEDDDPSQAQVHEAPGGEIGRYTLLEQIGEGGFGSVWLAQQREPVTRRVALKIIKLGMDTRQVIARFEAERQALASMDHPNLASVFDAGATESGRPYFVMELVTGMPLLEYCDEHRLDTTQRLNLFNQVCSAIQHAHQKGIIHRDIKPSNVLVSINENTPTVKVIDFGIAKATGEPLAQQTLLTQQRQLVGTPAYMSPEQADLTNVDIDTRSDIYALGVLLYELLTGTPPFASRELLAMSLDEMMRVIREEQPHKPSTRVAALDTARVPPSLASDERKLRTRTLKGDLDWIVMKCLAKERSRRYDTASALAADIQRHLQGEPVLAAPDSALYRVGKFITRHRTQVTAGAAGAAVLVLGIIGTTTGMLQAVDARHRADQETRRATAAEAEAVSHAQDLRKVAQFQAAMLADIDIHAMGETLRSDITDEAISALSEHDAVNADEQALLHSVFRNMNFTNPAAGAVSRHVLSRAARTIEMEFADKPLVQAQLLMNVGVAFQTLGQLDDAAAALDSALKLRLQELGDHHEVTQRTLTALAGTHYDRGRFDEAADLFMQSLESAQQVHADNPTLIRTSLHNVAVAMRAAGRHDEAERYRQQAFELSRHDDDTDRPTYSVVDIAALDWLLEQGRVTDAEAFLRDAINANDHALGSDHPDTLHMKLALARYLIKQRRFDDAEPLVGDVLATRRRVTGDATPATIQVIELRAQLHMEQQQWERAQSLRREVLALSREVFGHADTPTLQALARLSHAYQAAGDFAEARDLLTAAADDDYGTHDGSTHRRLAGMLADLYDAWHRHDPDAGHDAAAARWRSEAQQ